MNKPEEKREKPGTNETSRNETSRNETSKANKKEPATLRVEGLKKRFRKKLAVNDVSFRMRSGEVVGLLGPNGAGKTTVFYMIVGFIKPTAGQIYMNEHNITHRPMYRRALEGISYLPQEPSVFRKLTVEENIRAILETRRDLSPAQKKKRLEELLEEFNIASIRSQAAHPLSGGERRRTEIARSLAIDPAFLLLDEPFAGIDPIAVAEIKQLVGDLSRRGVGILITDHNVQHTLAITHRSYIIHLGEIVAHGDRSEILSNPIAREIYLGKDFEMP
jgi:lipopolysaccharide export system ATP-binding protein